MTNKEYKHKWYLEHRELIIARAKQRREEHIEERKEYAHKHYMENKERYIEKAIKWKEDNPEKEIERRNSKQYKEKRRQYRESHKEEIKKFQQYYSKTKNGRASKLSWAYRKKDSDKGYDTSANISGSWIVDNIFSGQECIYCGDSDWTHLGCDRIDNSKPHTADNCVCACFICNSDKKDIYTVEEFKKYRALHPRECDLPKKSSIEISETGALKKK